MANRPISVSMREAVGRPSPPAIFWKSQTTSSSGNGICCLASNLTISAIFFSSTGGSLTNRARPDWPAMPMATSSPLTSLRERNFSSASRMSLSGSASGWERILGCST